MSRAPAALALLSACLLIACETREVDAFGNNVAQAQQVDPCHAELFEESPLTVCTADPGEHVVRTALNGPGGLPLRSLAALAESWPGRERVAFAMNAGMYDGEGQPVGYYVEQGERRHRLNQAEGPGNFHLLPNGVFFGDAAGRWQVLDTASFAESVTDRPRFATQSGPMLVIDGELHPGFDPDGDSRKIRNGVGVDHAGRAHFVISEAPISFGRFARYFRDVLRTPNALFLDGSVSQLWDPGQGRIDGGPPLGPLIVVETRDDTP